jgi:hypothetical protein
MLGDEIRRYVAKYVTGDCHYAIALMVCDRFHESTHGRGN